MSETARIGKYRIVRELGRGAMGIVYEAHDPDIDRRVALKTIKRELVDDDSFFARFKREAQAAGRLTHPNIVNVFDYGETDDSAYIAMEYVEGRSLKAYLDADERFDLDRVAGIMRQLLGVLDYAHRLGVVHRDIKPANLMVLADGTVKVADFGIARVESSELTQAGSILGTPGYMSPEQFMGQVVDGRSDLFAAGVILFELLTGERPFPGKSMTTVMHKVLKEAPTPPSDLNFRLPPSLDAVVAKALAKRPAERYETGTAFREALEAAFATHAASAPTEADIETIVATPDDPDATLPGTIARQADDVDGMAETLVAPVQAPPASEAPRARHRGPAAAAALVGVAVLAAGLWFVLGRGAGETPPAAPMATTAPQTGEDVATVRDEGRPSETRASKPAASMEAPGAQAPGAPKSPAFDPNAPLAVTPSVHPDRITVRARGVAAGASDLSARAAAEADGRRQALEKVLGLYLDREALGARYAVLSERILSAPDPYLARVDAEAQPTVGRDGLMHAALVAEVRAKSLQAALNEIADGETAGGGRAAGNPAIAVEIDVRDAANVTGPVVPGVLAENVVKARIREFGYRIVTAGPPAPGDDALGVDFRILGEIGIKRLRHQLAASGVVIEKVAIAAWTLKCVNEKTGEEIYFDNVLPGPGSWNSEEEAVTEIGRMVAERFSREFFAQHSNYTGDGVRLIVEGLPRAATGVDLEAELVGLPDILEVRHTRIDRGRSAYDVVLSMPAEGGAAGAVRGAVIAPVNTKLGRECLAVREVMDRIVFLAFEPACADETTLTRFAELPPASLFVAPPERQRAVLRGYEFPDRYDDVRRTFDI